MTGSKIILIIIFSILSLIAIITIKNMIVSFAKKNKLINKLTSFISHFF